MTKRFFATCFMSGIIVFLLLYGFLPLDVTYDAWILNGYIETDIIQRYAGWLAYRQADSFFPLTFSQSIHYPFGGYVSLADSMPLFLILFKTLSPVLPQTFQFCGLVCCLNMGLQALCAAKLLSLFTQRKWQVFLGGVLFCCSPVLLERIFRHTSLSFHWLLLLALYYYIKGRRNPECFYGMQFAGLSVLSVWLHLYFTPMLIGFFLADVLQRYVISRERAAKHGAFFVATLALCVGSAYLLGILSMGTANTSGYGSFGLNLNALFNPVSLDSDWWVPGKGLQDWSVFLPVRALALNNLESFNYLGFGVLLALAGFGGFVAYRIIVAPKAVFKHIKTLVTTHFFLCCFFTVSVLFAISNTVCAFSYVLISIPLPERVLDICSAFRASGRLFWSVNYALVLLAVLFIIYVGNRYTKYGTVLLVALLCVQVVDLTPALRVKQERFSTREVVHNMDQMDTYVATLDDADTVFYLEIREDRELCAWLLKQNIKNNLWLISRNDYGVDEMQAQIDMAKQSLAQQGVSPFKNCVYATYDATFAKDVSQHDTITVQAIDGLYFILVSDVV